MNAARELNFTSTALSVVYRSSGLRDEQIQASDLVLNDGNVGGVPPQMHAQAPILGKIVASSRRKLAISYKMKIQIIGGVTKVTGVDQILLMKLAL